MGALKAKYRSSRRISCRICAHPTRERRICLAKKVICFSYELKGYHKGSPACLSYFKNKTNKNIPGLRGHV